MVSFRPSGGRTHGADGWKGAHYLKMDDAKVMFSTLPSDHPPNPRLRKDGVTKPMDEK